MKKRIISLLMCLVMAFSIVPAAAWAEVLPAPQDTPDSGAGTAGVYTTGEDTVVARIGDTGYASLPAALEAAGGRLYRDAAAGRHPARRTELWHGRVQDGHDPDGSALLHLR